jgi:hypothetical protein
MAVATAMAAAGDAVKSLTSRGRRQLQGAAAAVRRTTMRTAAILDGTKRSVNAPTYYYLHTTLKLCLIEKFCIHI